MPKCRVCFEEKQDAEFSFKNKARAHRHTLCKACTKAYSAAHYHRNVEQYKERAVANSATRREELHRRLFAFLAEHVCIDCGEADPLVLELDHRDSADKLHNLSRMWYNGYSWTKLRWKSPSAMSAVPTATAGGLHVSKIGPTYFGLQQISKPP